MPLHILRANNAAEAALWDSALEAIPAERRDIHMTSAYARVQSQNDGDAILAMLTTDDVTIIQPFILRHVPGDESLFDLCSPYGYGGPVASIDDSQRLGMAAISFRLELSAWCVEHRVVCEFCYLHPLFLEHQRKIVGLPSSMRLVKDVIVIDLAKLSEESVARRIRRGVRRARDQGALVRQVNATPVMQRAFASLYLESMNRKNAAERWRWNRDYIDAHWRELSARLYSASTGINSTAGGGVRLLMTIGGYGTAYAHLLASNGLAMHSGLDEALYIRAAMDLREYGYRRFHLGGGLTSASDDRLLAFKSGFSDHRYKLASYTRIFDLPAYEKLAAQKIEDEIAQHGGTIDNSHFFPLYRRDLT